MLARDIKELRERFGDQPIRMLQAYDPDIRFPAKIREIFALIWFYKQHGYRRFIIKGPRGGGKSKLLGAIGFCLWLFKKLDIVDMGGSEEQAKIIYNYFVDHCHTVRPVAEGLPGKPQMHRTMSDVGNYFKAIASSMKKIRGPHPDVLFGDEVCEAKDEHILAALPMVNTSPHQLVVLTSTFHNVFGLFQEIWDQADEYGYKRFSWDAFDVCMSFDASIWDDPQLNREIPDLHRLKALADGRTGDPEGWISIENVIQAWRERTTDDWFMVEYMGSRPSTVGLVVDPVAVDECTITNDDAITLDFSRQVNSAIGLDWGWSSMTAAVELWEHMNGVKVQRRCQTWTQTDADVIISDLCDWIETDKVQQVYADSSHKFENNALRNEIARRGLGCSVIEMQFGTHKDAMLANYRGHWEKRLIRIPKDHKVAIYQHKRFRYQKNSDRPVKEDDHIPDATMCALWHWPLTRVNEQKYTEQDIDAQGTILSRPVDV